MGRSRQAKCRVHGLHYNPAETSGCVLCRRAERPSSRRNWLLLIAGVGLVAFGVVATRSLLQVTAPAAVSSSLPVATASADIDGGSTRETQAIVAAPPTPNDFRVDVIGEDGPAIHGVGAWPGSIAIGSHSRLVCLADESNGPVRYRWRVIARSRDPVTTARMDGGVVAEGIGSEISWTGKIAGDYVATCIAANSSGASEKSTGLKVYEPRLRRGKRNPKNRAPVVSKVQCTQKKAGKVQCEADAIDPDNDRLDFYWSATRGSTISRERTAVFSVPHQTAHGHRIPIVVFVSAFDRDGDSATERTRIEVPTEACAIEGPHVMKDIEWDPPSAHLSAKMKRRGWPRTDAGALLAGPAYRGSMGIDPGKESTPLNSFLGCSAQINLCARLTNHNFDECVKGARRCRSAEPWKGDSAGPECCPQNCIDAYFNARRGHCALSSLKLAIDSGCNSSAAL